MTSKYWVKISVDSFGRCRCHELRENQEFFLQQFPGIAEQENVPERDIQRRLMHWYQNDSNLSQLAEGCLRCFISNQVKSICSELESKFGKTHNFTCDELLPLVVDSDRMRVSDPLSLTTRILKTFDPQKSNLSTWTNRIFKSHDRVKQFLLEHGIEQVTDWMILNHMTPGRLERILLYHLWTQAEIDQAIKILASYHQVYRTHLLQIRRPGAKTRYPEPTQEQLRQIADLCRDSQSGSSVKKISPEQVREKLQKLASLLREERIRVRTGLHHSERLEDNRKTNNLSREKNEESEFLAEYQQEFDSCLKKSIELVIQNRFKYLQSKNSAKFQEKAQNYIKALHLFHCQGVSMAEIATRLRLSDQPKVSRLVELKNLRSDIERNTLSCLLKAILNIAQAYVTPEKIQDLESTIQAILAEEIKIVIDQAKKDASIGREQVQKNLLAQAICQYLDTIVT